MGSNVVFYPAIGFFLSTTGMKITIVFVNIFIEEKLQEDLSLSFIWEL